MFVAGAAMAEGETAAQPTVVAQAKPETEKPAETSREALFGLDDKAAAKAPASSGWHGYVQFEAARAYRSPEHWSKARLRLDLNRQGQFSENVKWKIGGR